MRTVQRAPDSKSMLAKDEPSNSFTFCVKSFFCAE